MAYIASTRIKVFPTNSRDKKYNPSSWKTTEENFRKLLTIANTTKDFVKGDDNDLIIVMKGYVFIVAKSDVVSTASQSDTVIYASIVTEDVDLNPGATDIETTSILGDGSTLDKPNSSNVDEFVGISFSNASSEGSLLVLQKDSSDEWIIPEASKCVIKSDVIYNEVGTEKKAISEEFNSKKISTEELGATAINAQNVEVATKVTSPEFDSEQTLVVGTESTDVFKGTATRAINDSKGYKLDSSKIADTTTMQYDTSVGKLVFNNLDGSSKQVDIYTVPNAEVAQNALKVESGTSDKGYVLIKPYDSAESHEVKYVPSMVVQQANGKCFISDAVVGYAKKLTSGIGTSIQTYSVGDAYTPVYFYDGVPNICFKYAGGSRVTLNGVVYGSQGVYFVAPTNYGNQGSVLVGGGTGSEPTWSSGLDKQVLVSRGPSQAPQWKYLIGSDTLIDTSISSETSITVSALNQYDYLEIYTYVESSSLSEKPSHSIIISVDNFKKCTSSHPLIVGTSTKDNNKYLLMSYKSNTSIGLSKPTVNTMYVKVSGIRFAYN